MSVWVGMAGWATCDCGDGGSAPPAALLNTTGRPRHKNKKRIRLTSEWPSVQRHTCSDMGHGVGQDRAHGSVALAPIRAHVGGPSRQACTSASTAKSTARQPLTEERMVATASVLRKRCCRCFMRSLMPCVWMAGRERMVVETPGGRRKKKN